MLHKIVHMFELIVIYLERALIGLLVLNGIHNLIQITLGLFRSPQDTGFLEEIVMPASVLFYQIECLVRSSEQLLKLSSVRPGDTDTHRKLGILKYLCLFLLFVESFQKLFHLVRNSFLVCHPRQIIQELIPAGTAHNLVLADFLQHIRHCFQRIVPHQVTVHIINLSEMIQVYQH